MEMRVTVYHLTGYQWHHPDVVTALGHEVTIFTLGAPEPGDDERQIWPRLAALADSEVRIDKKYKTFYYCKRLQY